MRIRSLALAALMAATLSSLPGCRKRAEAAKADPLLAQNLALHFIGPQTETMSQLLAPR